MVNNSKNSIAEITTVEEVIGLERVDDVTITINKNDDITVIVISGESGSGKSLIAHAISDYFSRIGNMSVVWMVSEYDTEQYSGQDVVVFDDVSNALDIVKNWQNKGGLRGRFHDIDKVPSVVIVTEAK